MAMTQAIAPASIIRDFILYLGCRVGFVPRQPSHVISLE
jgi:hypothetical protein